MAHLTLGYLTLDATPIETITAAAESGFGSVGIRITGRRVADPYTKVIGDAAMLAGIRQRLADTGVRLSNVSAYHFFDDVTWSDLDRVLDTTAELGAPIIVANNYIPDESRFLDLFGRYAEKADQLGIRLAIEFMRYSECKSLGDASRLVTAANRPNAGYLIDPLHLERSGGTPAQIASVDARQIVFVQFCDAMLRQGEMSVDELRTEARNGRLHPGDGELPLDAFLDVLPPGIEIEVEVPRPDAAALPHAQRALIARERAMRFLAEHAAKRGREVEWS